MSRPAESVRWTLHHAAQEFGLDRKTLDKQIKSAGVVPGDDGFYSTLDMCRAIYGDLRGELIRAQTRDTNEAADIKAVKKANLLRENIPADMVERVWSGIIIDLRQKILYAEIPDQLKQEILHDMENIPVENYFKEAQAADDADDEEESK